MKKIVMILFVVAISACSTGLYIIPKEYIEIKEYQLDDFVFYVFNICEDYKKEPKNYRFCECPENFHELSKKNSIKKVEELYLLIHKKKNLALYLTTFSHKYIYENQTGFLNDSSIYKNSIILDQIESYYIGLYEIEDNTTHIYFKSRKRGQKDIELHFNKSSTSDTLTIDSVNIACVENKYSISNPKELEGVFSRDLKFIKSNYKMYFYENMEKVGTVCKKEVDKLYMTTNKNGIELIFDYENCMDNLYKITLKKIPYQPNFSLIE